MRSVIKYFFYLLMLLIALVALFLFFSIWSDFKPEKEGVVYENGAASKLEDTLEFSILSWNIGYCGLDSAMDFFYDGGQSVRPPKIKVVENCEAITAFLSAYKTLDFVLLQEVDIDSKRSYNMNQFEVLESHFPTFESYFATNYDVFFVPLPLTQPMGKAESGLMTLSRFTPNGVMRHAYEGNYDFPTALFMLDRCFMVNRYPLASGKSLLVINTHNSAFDDGSLRQQQMDQLTVFLREEYAAGNYVLVGGDWNQCPPNLKPEIAGWQFDTTSYMPLCQEIMPLDWSWNYDAKTPTNRRVSEAFNREETLTTLIDFILVSPNIKCLSVETIDLGFAHSDHNPVRAQFKLIVE